MGRRALLDRLLKRSQLLVGHIGRESCESHALALHRALHHGTHGFSTLSPSEELLLRSGATAVTHTITLQELVVSNQELQDQMVQAYRSAAQGQLQDILDTLSGGSGQLDALQQEHLLQLEPQHLRHICRTCDLDADTSSSSDMAAAIHSMLLEEQARQQEARAKSRARSSWRLGQQQQQQQDIREQLEMSTDELFDDDLLQRLQEASKAAAARAAAENAAAEAAAAAARGQLLQPAQQFLAPSSSTSLKKKAAMAMPGVEVDPYAPLPGVEVARQSIEAFVGRALARAGYASRDPAELSSLRLLRLAVLAELLEDVGLDGFGSKESLAQRLQQLLLDVRAEKAAAAAAAAAEAEAGGPAHADNGSMVQDAAAVHGGEADAEGAAGRRRLFDPAAVPGSSAGTAASTQQQQDQSAHSSGSIHSSQQDVQQSTSTTTASGQPAAAADAGLVAAADSGSVTASSEAASAGITRSPQEREQARVIKRWKAQMMMPDPEATREPIDIATKAAGSQRRAHILLGDLIRQRVLDEVVHPVQVCSWLSEAKAEDVVLIDVHGRAGFTDYLVLATGQSHVHSGNLVEAVRYRLKEKLKGRLAGVDEAYVRRQLEEAGQGQYVREAGIDVSQLQVKVEPPAVAGVPGSDWLAVDAGKVVVHVMSAAARQYYDVEGIWGLPGTVKRFSGEVYVTKDSIGQAEM